MDRLWSPWRLEYILSNKTDSGCPFCDAPAVAEQQSLIVFQGRLCYVILNLYPYNNGHIMVVPYRHVASFALLTPDELQELALLTQRSEIALLEGYSPHGLNVGWWWHSRAPSRAPGAALEWRLELHDDGW